jgi:enoyl-CoA hydratase
MHTFTAIIYEVERGRARITLNRPDKLNALSPTLLSELHDALWEADDDRDVHGVILRGAGRCSPSRDLTPLPACRQPVPPAPPPSRPSADR